MSSVKRKCHVKALSENLELGLIGGLFENTLYVIEVINHLIHDGITCFYIFLGLGLICSALVLAVALFRHHQSNVKHQLGLLLTVKKQLNKCKMRHHRK